MNDRGLSEIEARANAATPGPWIQARHVGEPRAITTVADPERSLLGLDRDDMAICDREADAAFIAYARTDIPRLLARIRQLEREGDDLMRERDALTEAIDAIHANLGCETEWSNLHDCAACAVELSGR